MATIAFDESFELLEKGEWGKYMSHKAFRCMQINADDFCINEDSFPIQRLRIPDMIFDHNNKVGSLAVTYALCRHYYDKGIPDDPWYISTGGKGERTQYFPNFSPEHFGRQYWFNYFTNVFYFQIFALWDSVIEIIINYYGYELEHNMSLKKAVCDNLKNDSPQIAQIFLNIKNDEIYKQAQEYRTKVAHGTPAGIIQDTKVVIPSERLAIYRVGDYTNTATFMENIEKFSLLTGGKIQEIVGYMISG